MARVLSRTLLSRSTATAKPVLYASAGRRHRSSEASDEPMFIVIDLGSSSSSLSPSAASTSENHMGGAAMNIIDDLVKLSLINKIKPDWLPFLPGSSFWVPPIPSVNHLMPLVDPEKRKLLNVQTEEETLPDSDLRGLPCSTFLLPEDDEESNEDAIVLELKGLRDAEMEVKLVRNPTTSQFDDDEGEVSHFQNGCWHNDRETLIEDQTLDILLGIKLMTR